MVETFRASGEGWQTRTAKPCGNTSEFSQRKAPDTGGRLYVAMGVYKTLLITVSRGWDSGELLINGARIEAVHNNPEFIVIDLQPGQYIVTWLPLAEFERSNTRANPAVVTVQDGEVQFLALDAAEGMNLKTVVMRFNRIYPQCPVRGWVGVTRYEHATSKGLKYASRFRNPDFSLSR